MFSMVTVVSSTRIPTASAKPPSVIVFNVCPSAPSTKMDDRIESGMETATIAVLRKLPRNNRIIVAVRHAAIHASVTTP